MRGRISAEVFEAHERGAGFRLHQAGERSRLLFVHRKLADGDLYFVDNRSDHGATVDATFRVTGKEPELWHRGDGQDRSLARSRLPRPHHGAAETGAMGHGIRGLPQGDARDLAHVAGGRGDGAGHGRWSVEGELPGGARRTCIDHAGSAFFVELTARTRA